MLTRLSVVVLLLSVMSSVLGASVSVNVTELEKNATHLDNSTKALNGSQTILNIREAVLIKLNASDVSMNSTSNSTSLNATMKALREAGDEKLILDLGNSSKSGNFSTKLNDTMKADNVTTRAVNASMSSLNSTQNATVNVWSALPLFRDLNSTLHNSSLRNSSESVNGSKSVRAVDSAENSIENEDSAAEDLSDLASNNTKSDSMDDMEDLDQDNGNGSTKKPCTTVSCLISRGCSDDSCSQNDN